MFSNRSRRVLCQRLLPVVLTFFSAAATALPVAVDLSTWSARNTTGAAGKWVVAADGKSVVQTANAAPSFFVSKGDYLNTTLRATVRVDDKDDDLFGFVFGYKSPAAKSNDMEFLLFDWRKATQTLNGSTGKAGFSLSQVKGTINNPVPSFWGHESSNSFKVLDSKYGPNQGWASGIDYDFTIRYDADRVRVDLAGGVFGTGTHIFDMAGNFGSGGIGLYDYSQPQARFSKLTLDLQASNPVPEPGSVALLSLALCGVLVSRQRRSGRRSVRGSRTALSLG